MPLPVVGTGVEVARYTRYPARSSSVLAVHDRATAPLAAPAPTPAGAAGGGSAELTVQVNVSAGVALAVPSLTLTVTLYVPAAPAASVPLMRPVAGAMVTPLGRFVAL